MGAAQNVLLLGGRKAHELHWPAQIVLLTLQCWSVKVACGLAPCLFCNAQYRLSGLHVRLLATDWVYWACCQSYPGECHKLCGVFLRERRLQLTRDLFPALCALCPICLPPDLLGVFATFQLRWRFLPAVLSLTGLSAAPRRDASRTPCGTPRKARELRPEEANVQEAAASPQPAPTVKVLLSSQKRGMPFRRPNPVIKRNLAPLGQQPCEFSWR